MSYQVVVLRRAELELYDNALWWAENRDPDQAVRWLEGFQAAIANLAVNPQQHGHIDEAHLFDFPVQRLLFGIGKKPTHRAVFRIRGDEVYVYTVRHLHQQELRPEDL